MIFNIINIKIGECWQLPSPYSLYTFTCWANMSVNLPDLLMPFSWEPVSIASGEWAASHLTSASWPQLIATGMEETDRKRRVKSVGIERDTSEHVAPEREKEREKEREYTSWFKRASKSPCLDSVNGSDTLLISSLWDNLCNREGWFPLQDYPIEILEWPKSSFGR